MANAPYTPTGYYVHVAARSNCKLLLAVVSLNSIENFYYQIETRFHTPRPKEKDRDGERGRADVEKKKIKK